VGTFQGVEGSVLPCRLLWYRRVLNTGERSIDRVMKGINVTGHNIPIGHPHAQKHSAVLGVGAKYWDKQGQQMPEHLPWKEYQRTKKVR